MEWVYLDNNATTRPANEVVYAMNAGLTRHWANASSVHRFGQATRQELELARVSLAGLIGATARELVLTSGGTEANTLAIKGVLDVFTGASGGTGGVAMTLMRPLVITTGIEHSAVREPLEKMEKSGIIELHCLKLDAAGRIVLSDLEWQLTRATNEGRLVLISIQWANNETGVIQPMKLIGELVARLRAPGIPGTDGPAPAGVGGDSGSRLAPGAGPVPGVSLTVMGGLKAVFHTDATQAVGKVPVDVKLLGVDLLTLAAHKFHGPKGVGALYVKNGTKLRPQQQGGPQERDRRAGTENTPGVLGMGEAARLAGAFLSDVAGIERLKALRDKLEMGLLETCPGSVVNGVDAVVEQAHDVFAGRLWNTTNIGFPRLEAEAILLALSERGICASAGAACSSGSLEPSPVLLAMGVKEELAHGSVRFSISRETTAQEIERALVVVPEVVGKLYKSLP
jgi:cysteine desulfurase